jgi:DNA invertase Pin-like site-specific DNA recombinase
MNMRGAFAKYDRAKIAERCARGQRGRAKAGHIPGGMHTYGYRYINHEAKGDDYDPDTHACRTCGQPGTRGGCYAIDPEEAALVQRIFTLYVGGMSQEAIAALLTTEGHIPPGDRRRGPKRRLAVPMWHQSTITRMVRNETYAGILHYGKRQRMPGKANPDKKPGGAQWTRRSGLP